MSWIQQAQKRNVQRLQSIYDSAPSLSFDPQAAHKGWRDVTVIYDCIQDPLYPYDPAVIKRIQQFRPEVAPLRVRYVYRRPRGDSRSYDTKVITLHGLGTYDPGYPAELQINPEMPSNFPAGLTFQKPNHIRFVHYSTLPAWSDFVGEYLPCDGSFYAKAKELLGGDNFEEDSQKAILAMITRQEQQKKFLEEEKAYRNADLQKYAQKQFDKMSDVEHKEYALHGAPKKEKPLTIQVPGLPGN